MWPELSMFHLKPASEGAKLPTLVADKLPNDYQSLLVVVVVVAVMPNDYHMVVVAAVVAVMPIWLRKSAGCKEHKQDEYQILLHVRKVTNAHNDCLCYIALIPESFRQPQAISPSYPFKRGKKQILRPLSRKFRGKTREFRGHP
jgi:hypothetical protein